MIINKGFKYRIYPDKEQIQQLKQIAGNNRFIWNEFLAFTNGYKELYGKYLYRYDLQNYILDLKEDYPFLKLSYSQSLQYQALSLDKAIHRTFDEDIVKQRQKAIAKAMAEPNDQYKQGKINRAYHYGFPKYKKKSNYNDTICYPQFFEIKKDKIKLPKIGWINYKQHRKIEGIAKYITISQDGNQWYCSICCELDIPEQTINTNLDNIIGIDLGLTEFAVFSDGTVINNPRIYRKQENKLKKEQRKLSRRQKESNRRKRQQLRVHKLHRKIRNKRKDFLHKLTHHMITKYDGFILEDLSSKNMMKNHNMAKSIQDASWSEFSRILKYKSSWYFKYFEKIDRFAPSSQICSNCGHRQNMPLDVRTYICPDCESEIDRDLNASLNIKCFSILYTDGTSEIYGQGESAVALSENCQKFQSEKIGSLCL